MKKILILVMCIAVILPTVSFAEKKAEPFSFRNAVANGMITNANSKVESAIYDSLDTFTQRYNNSLKIETDMYSPAYFLKNLAPQDFKLNLERGTAAYYGSHQSSEGYIIVVTFDEKYAIKSADSSFWMTGIRDSEIGAQIMQNMLVCFMCTANGIDEEFTDAQKYDYLDTIVSNTNWEIGVVDAVYNDYEYDNYISHALEVYGVVITKK